MATDPRMHSTVTPVADPKPKASASNGTLPLHRGGRGAQNKGGEEMEGEQAAVGQCKKCKGGQRDAGGSSATS